MPDISHRTVNAATTANEPSERRLLAALLLVSGALGSIHAFSVLLEPLEERLGAERGSVSLAYSLALGLLTVAVAVGHRLYHRASPSLMLFIACGVAGGGVVLAALLTSVENGLVGLWVGYGVVFGFANGVGYGYALALANDRIEQRRGQAMGAVTAVYAVGAAVAAFGLDRLARDGPNRALFALGAAIVLAGGIAAVLLRGLTPIARAPSTSADFDSNERRWIVLGWLTYGTGVAAGLMALGHAAGVIEAVGGSDGQAVVGTIAVVVMNGICGLGVGWVAERVRPAAVLGVLAAISAAALLAIAWVDQVGSTIAGLAGIGGAYGATIALFPVVTANQFGSARYARAYGRVFTSWGVAGLVAPWIAGTIFASTGSYTTPLILAAALALASAGLAVVLGGMTNESCAISRTEQSGGS